MPDNTMFFCSLFVLSSHLSLGSVKVGILRQQGKVHLTCSYSTLRWRLVFLWDIILSSFLGKTYPLILFLGWRMRSIRTRIIQGMDEQQSSGIVRMLPGLSIPKPVKIPPGSLAYPLSLFSEYLYNSLSV